MAPENKSNLSFGLSARFLFVVAGVSILSNLILISAFLNFFPLRRIQSFYLETQNIQDKSVYITPFKLPKDQKQIQTKIIESLVRQYVLERERLTTDFRLLETLWGSESSLRYMSSRKVYQDFIHSSIYKKVYLLANQKRKSRFVEIKRIEFQSNKKEWIVTGRVVDYQDRNSTKQVQDLKVVIQAGFSENAQKMTYKNQFKNPFGFVITNYQYLRRPSY
ncbi:MAG: VirB8/TrbF family protein [Alphaproteobacteria bacterium]